MNNNLDINNRKIPCHIGIIVDGNGRWAKKRKLPRSFGHKAGASNLKKIIKYCNKINIKYLTVYVFSTENWKRPLDEVKYLMGLFEQYLKDALKEIQDDNIKIKVLGDKQPLSPKLKDLIKRIEEVSANKTGMTLNVAMNYGGRDEITTAVKKISSDVSSNLISLKDITPELIAKNLYTAGQPDPDLIIRTSGEYRLSNFLMWQSAYSELIFTDVLWPDFTENDLEKAINEYSARIRRFGGI